MTVLRERREKSEPRCGSCALAAAGRLSRSHNSGLCGVERKARAEPGEAPLLTDLFTAVCLTGLIVQDTPTYWSGLGQGVIPALFQIGGFVITTAARRSWGSYRCSTRTENRRLKDLRQGYCIAKQCHCRKRRPACRFRPAGVRCSSGSLKSPADHRRRNRSR
jgi:hypothetical protein